MEKLHYRDQCRDFPLPVLEAMAKAHEGMLETDLPDETRDDTHLSLVAIRSHIIAKTRLAPLARTEGDSDVKREMPEPSIGL